MIKFYIVIDIVGLAFGHLESGLVPDISSLAAEGESAMMVPVFPGVTCTVQASILSGKADFNRVSPYIGISWGNLIGRSRRWRFYSDFGVAFTDSHDVVLRANGTQAADPAFQADLAREAKDITYNLDDFEVYPIISVGFYSRF